MNKQRENERYDVAVIGAGIAGLTAAALLQHDGARVLLVEKHDKPGGCAGYFSINDKQLGNFTFDAGATVALGFEMQGLHRRVFDYLHALPCDAEMLNGLHVHLPDREITIWHDAGKWQTERQKLPGHRVRQETFWKLQETVADAGWAALGRLPSLPLQTARDWGPNMRLIHPALIPLLPFLPVTMGNVVRALNLRHDRAFMALVNLGLMITVQESASRAPFTNGCAGLDLWRHGAWHLRGGMGAIARTLLETFRRDGGAVYMDKEVQRIVPCDEGFQIVTQDQNFVADRVIANMPIQNVHELVELPAHDNEEIERRVARNGTGWGAVTLYAAVREAALPSSPFLHYQTLQSYGGRPGNGEDVFISLSAHGDEEQAPRGWRTLTASTHTNTTEWKNLSALEYRAKKPEWREKLLRGVRRALPAFDDNRKFVLCGTPRTWAHYTNRKDGFVGGIPLTQRTANLRATPRRLSENFWLVGDTTFPGQGTVACALSGINAWRDITGKPTL